MNNKTTDLEQVLLVQGPAAHVTVVSAASIKALIQAGVLHHVATRITKQYEEDGSSLIVTRIFDPRDLPYEIVDTRPLEERQRSRVVQALCRQIVRR